MAYGTGGHADRAEQIGLVTFVMARCLPVIGRGKGSYRGEAMAEVPAADGMNVTERQAEIDGERNQRKPRTARLIWSRNQCISFEPVFPWTLPAKVF
jgi:hypothetical protein